MSSIWYLTNAEKTAKKKLRDHEKASEKQDSDLMFGRTPYHWTDSALTSMGLMAVMGLEFMICIMLDFIVLAGILVMFW